MNLYCCRIVEDGWCTEYTKEKDYIWALDPEEARKFICKKWGIRKNKKGLRIEKTLIIRATKSKRYETCVETARVWNSFLQQTEEQSAYVRKPYYVCDSCKGRVYQEQNICLHCGALFEEEEF